MWGWWVGRVCVMVVVVVALMLLCTRGDESVKFGTNYYHDLKLIYVTADSLFSKLKPANPAQACNAGLNKAIPCW